MEKQSTVHTAWERFTNGLIRENPTFVLMLGMCPTLAVTTSAKNGLGMGLTTTVVLMLSNLIISLLRKIIPNRVRIPAFIVIIASFVTAVQLLLEAYLPALNTALGMYIPLIVVNCIILGRAESYAYSNPPIPSLFDGLGMGLGFTFALGCIGMVRELLGAGTFFDRNIFPESFTPINIFVLAPGAFFVLASLTAFQNYLKIRGKRAGKDVSKLQSGCSEDCMNCSDTGCSRRFYDETGSGKKPEDKKTDGKAESAKITIEKKPQDKKTDGKAEQNKPESDKAEDGKAEQNKPESDKAEGGKAEQNKPESDKAEDGKAEQNKSGENKPGNNKSEGGKAEQNKSGNDKPESDKAKNNSTADSDAMNVQTKNNGKKSSGNKNAKASGKKKKQGGSHPAKNGKEGK